MPVRGTGIRVGVSMTAEAAWTAASAVVEDLWLVGGSVRDELMGRSSEDFDFVTPLSADEIEAAIRAAGRKPYTVGKRFGTVGMMAEGCKLEITTLRGATLDEDLRHRDFTINAMAWQPGLLEDPFGGRADLEAGVLRAPGSARSSIRDDALRILRAARFESELGFSADEELREAMARHAHRLAGVAKERCALELDRMLSGAHAAKGVRLLAETGALAWVLPELALQEGYEQNSPYHDRDLFEHTLAVVEAVEPADLDMRWAALLHDVGKPYVRAERPGRSTYVHHELLSAEIVDRVATSLKWSRARHARVRELVAGHMERGSVLRAADDSAKPEHRPGS